MKPEAQRIAIAEACGIKNIQKGGYCYIPEGQKFARSKPVPDYLNDLNAMHEAENVLTYDQLPFYIALLKNPVLMKEGGVSAFDIVHATAAQRAEAFLRCIGKWVSTSTK